MAIAERVAWISRRPGPDRRSFSDPTPVPDVRRIATFQRELLARVRNLPGVHSAGFGGYLPLGGAGNSWAPRIEGRCVRWRRMISSIPPVTPGYIETLAIPLIMGRHFTDADTGGTRRCDDQ